MNDELYLGIDFGTSGARAIAIDSETTIRAEVNYPFPPSTDLPQLWKNALFWLLENLSITIRKNLKAIAINGTSSTVLLCDAEGNPIDDPILYNDSRGREVLEFLTASAPPDHPVLSATSSLAKLLWWQKQPIYPQAAYFLHQADWLGFLLQGKLGISDYHNALKLGYDVKNLIYPQWLTQLPISPLLPEVLPPGTTVGRVTDAIATRFELGKDCRICTGTTDSIAAFLASGAKNPGDGVTSLGSTLVLKLLSEIPIEDAKSGVYSHRLGNLWLTGGASNTGGAVLRHYFKDEELEELSQQINPNESSILEYYPLLKPGERFPINDPNLLPKINPIPHNRVEFLQGLLESIARIEGLGYERLQALGATELKQVYTAGGGAKNETWRLIRQRYLKVPLITSHHAEAAYGTALLAKFSLNNE